MHLNDCFRSHMELACVGSIQSTIFHEDKSDISSYSVLTPFNEVYQIQIEKTESQEQKNLHGPPAWTSQLKNLSVRTSKTSRWSEQDWCWQFITVLGWISEYTFFFPRHCILSQKLLWFIYHLSFQPRAHWCVFKELYCSGARACHREVSVFDNCPESGQAKPA